MPEPLPLTEALLSESLLSLLEPPLPELLSPAPPGPT